MTAGRRWVLARRPEGVPSTDDFRLEDMTLPPLQDGQALIRVDHISVDPGMRSRLSGDSYAPALDLGATIESAGVGEVIASRSAKLKEGTRVWGGFGWQTHLLTDGRGVQALDPNLYTGPITPTAATRPINRLKPMAVWITTRLRSLSPAPRYWVITTLVPILTKLNRVMARSNT